MNATILNALRSDCDSAIEIAGAAAAELGQKEKVTFDYAIEEFANRYASIDNRRFDNVTVQAVFELCANYDLPLATPAEREARAEHYEGTVKPILKALCVVHNYLERTWKAAPERLLASVIDRVSAKHVEETIPELFAAKLAEYRAS